VGEPGGRPENLTPFKPGQVGNPEGKNQYTYRADAERDLAAWCEKYGQELIERLLDDAKKGKGWAMKLALDRILPAVQQHDVTTRVETSDEELVDRLASIARAKRANGHDLEPDALTEGDDR
jgi:hypothetical protein